MSTDATQAEALLGRFQAAITADGRRAVAAFLEGKDTSPVYAVVLNYDTHDGGIGWSFQTARLLGELVSKGYDRDRNFRSPDGVKFVGLEPFAGNRIQDLEDMRASYVDYVEGLSPFAFVTFSRRVEERIVGALKELMPEFERLDRSPDFVVFAADHDGANTDLVFQTVPRELFLRVFPDADRLHLAQASRNGLLTLTIVLGRALFLLWHVLVVLPWNAIQLRIRR